MQFKFGFDFELLSILCVLGPKWTRRLASVLLGPRMLTQLEIYNGPTTRSDSTPLVDRDNIPGVGTCVNQALVVEGYSVILTLIVMLMACVRCHFMQQQFAFVLAVRLYADCM